MQRIYPVQTVDQLALFGDEIDDGIESIIEGGRQHGQEKRTHEQIWEELVEHVTTAPHAKMWLVIEDGILKAWLCGKIYVDGKKRNGVITWAWAAPGCRVSQDVVLTAEAFFKERECQVAYLGRAFLQRSFTRLMRRYGYAMATVVYEKRLDEVAHGDSVGPAGREIRADDAVGKGRDQPEESPVSADDADVRSAVAGDRGPDGASAGDGDSGADTAGSLGAAGDGAGDAERQQRDRSDAEAAVECGHLGDAGESDFRAWGDAILVAGGSDEPGSAGGDGTAGGPADAGAVGPPEPGELLHVHAECGAGG